MDDTQRQHLEALRDTQLRSLRALEKQAAQFGLQVPTAIINEIAERRLQLADIEQQLHGRALLAADIQLIEALPFPKVWNLPARNPNFTGREAQLAALRSGLIADQTMAVTQPHAMYGLGGIGKSQLAIEYAYRHVAEYSVGWWLPSDEPVALAGGYAGLAARLKLPEHSATEQEVVRDAVRTWLEQHTGWLLVFDNANEPTELEQYLPRHIRGHIIVTSRNPNWGAIAKSAGVPVLPTDEAVAFLLHRTGQADATAAAQLADALGCLPLALAQAGAYIETTGQSLAEYLALFQSYHSELLAEGQPTDYPATVAKTWELSYKRVRQRSRAAADLLSLCAYLGADGIPLAMVRAGVEYLTSPLATVVAHPVRLDTAIAALRRYSLLERSESTLSLHRMVQAVVRDWLGATGRQTWAAAAVAVVDAGFRYWDNDPQIWSECANLLPHALVAAEYAAKLKSVPQTTARLWNKVGLYLRQQAEFVAAKGAFERAMAIDQATYGPNHPEVAIRVNNLGRVLQDLGDLAGAKAALERALAIDEVTYGPNHPIVATLVNNLGLVLHDLGDRAGATAAYERALAIDEASYGPNHPNIGIRVNNLGGVLLSLGDLVGAKVALERALDIFQRSLGAEHPSTRTVQNNLDDLKRQESESAAG